MGHILASLGSALGGAGAGAGAGMAGAAGGGGLMSGIHSMASPFSAGGQFNFGQFAHNLAQNVLKSQGGGSPVQRGGPVAPPTPQQPDIQSYLNSLFGQVSNHDQTAPYIRSV